MACMMSVNSCNYFKAASLIRASLPFEICPEKSKVKDLELKLQCETSHLQAEKQMLSSHPNTCHSPWWAVCLGTASRPRLRSLTSPDLPQAAQRQALLNPESKVKEKTTQKQLRWWCSLCFQRDFVWCEANCDLCFAPLSTPPFSLSLTGMPQNLSTHTVNSRFSVGHICKTLPIFTKCLRAELRNVSFSIMFIIVRCPEKSFH